MITKVSDTMLVLSMNVHRHCSSNRDLRMSRQNRRKKTTGSGKFKKIAHRNAGFNDDGAPLWIKCKKPIEPI